MMLLTINVRVGGLHNGMDHNIAKHWVCDLPKGYLPNIYGHEFI